MRRCVRKYAVRDGDYSDLAGAAVVMITAGLNEKGGGATDRGDATGRLKLLDTNVGVFRDMVPQIVAAAPEAVLLVVTDPPDPLADLTRELAGHDRVLSTGTLLDSLRFRTASGRAAGGESEVGRRAGGRRAWHVGSVVVVECAGRRGAGEVGACRRGRSFEEFRAGVERDVRFANITIIEGNDASQFGIGIVSTRIAEAVLRDEQAVLPVGVYNAKYGVTLSLPCVVGKDGAGQVLEPAMTNEERQCV